MGTLREFVERAARGEPLTIKVNKENLTQVLKELATYGVIWCGNVPLNEWSPAEEADCFCDRSHIYLNISYVGGVNQGLLWDERIRQGLQVFEYTLGTNNVVNNSCCSHSRKRKSYIGPSVGWIDYCPDCKQEVK